MEKVNQNTSDEYIKALMNISSAITSDLYLEELLKLIVMVTARATDSEICSLWLIDESEQPPQIRLKATQAIAPEYVKDRSLDLNEGVVGMVVESRKPFVIEEVLTNSSFKEKDMARRLGLVSMVGVPLTVKDEKVIGVLNCFTSVRHEFSEMEINLITAVANQAAVAILNTELMVKTKVIQEELETRKLIDKAKDIIMLRKDMNGKDAFRWMQKRSMDTRKSLRNVAEAILLSEEIYS